jgi:hypothetical protein
MGAPVGNQNAARAKVWHAAIMRALEKRGGGDRIKALDELAGKLLDLVATGDLAALKEFGDRMDGKPAQALIHQGDEEGGPVRVEKIERVIRRADVANRNG